VDQSETARSHYPRKDRLTSFAMLNIPELLAQELSLKSFQVHNALELLAEGATVPFIARYRKERTGEMTETQLRELFDRYAYLTELEERKQTILQAIAQQGKLTPELQAEIERCSGRPLSALPSQAPHPRHNRP